MPILKIFLPPDHLVKITFTLNPFSTNTSLPHYLTLNIIHTFFKSRFLKKITQSFQEILFYKQLLHASISNCMSTIMRSEIFLRVINEYFPLFYILKISFLIEQQNVVVRTSAL